MGRTYRDEFPPGTRVVVRADKNAGTDHEFDGRAGTIVEYGKFIAVDFDKPPKYWPNPYLITPHNLRAISSLNKTGLDSGAEKTAESEHSPSTREE